MKIETVKTNSLVLDSKNARKHDEKNLAAIKNSLQSFGQRKPIVITEANTVVAGNGTLLAALDLQWEQIEVVRIPKDWTEEQITAFALADNRTAELADWDESILTQSLLELNTNGWDIETLGFAQITPPGADEWENAFDGTSKDRALVQQMTFTVTDEQVETIKEALQVAVNLGEFPEEINSNKNGNALARICELFLGTQI
jgi:hypothetical protein